LLLLHPPSFSHSRPEPGCCFSPVETQERQCPLPTGTLSPSDPNIEQTGAAVPVASGPRPSTVTGNRAADADDQIRMAPWYPCSVSHPPIHPHSLRPPTASNMQASPLHFPLTHLPGPQSGASACFHRPSLHVHHLALHDCILSYTTCAVLGQLPSITKSSQMPRSGSP